MSDVGRDNLIGPGSQEPSAERETSARELPEAVRTLIEARTGDAVYVVGPQYSIVHWDEQMEASACSTRA